MIISNLPGVTTATGAMVVPIVDGSTTKKVTLSQIKQYATSGETIAVSTSSLSNGDAYLQLDSSGNLNFSVGGQIGDVLGANGFDFLAPNGMAWAELNYASDQYMGVDTNGAFIQTNFLTTLTNTWSFLKDGNITLPAGGDILDGGTGLSVLGSGSGGGTTTTWATLGDKNNENGPIRIALGYQAGLGISGETAVAIGTNAGRVNQDIAAVSVGSYSGQNNQGQYTVAIGNNAGNSSQTSYAVSIGNAAGYTHQGSNAVAIGPYAGQYYQSQYAVAIGVGAGQNHQGANAIAIGFDAGEDYQYPNSIVINAGGAPLNNTTTSGLFINPVRKNSANTANALYYNTSTGELTYTTATSGSVFNGGTITNQLNINNGTPSYSTLTGALVVAGGVGIGGHLYSGEIYITYDSSDNMSYPSGFDAGLFITNTFSEKTGVTLVGASGNRIYMANSGTTFYLASSNAIIDPTTSTGSTQILSADTTNVKILRNTPATNTVSGALVVGGGVGIGGNLYASNIYSNGYLISTASNYSLPTASTSTKGGIKVDGTTFNVNAGTGVLGITFPNATVASLGVVQVGAGVDVDVNGVISVTTGAFALQTATSVILGGVKIGAGITATADGTISVTGTGLGSRSTATTSTSLLTAGSSQTCILSIAKSYILQKITVTTATWLIVYTSAAALAADATRTQGTDPTPGSGVIAEIITAQSGSVIMSPGVIGFNDDLPSVSTVYMKAVNISSSSANISITLRTVPLEV